MRSLALALILAFTTLSFGSAASAQSDLISVGDDARVAAGQTVRDVKITGGDVVIDGHVTRDVHVAGGDILIRGIIDGDVHVVGGDVIHEGFVGGQLETVGGSVHGHSVHEDSANSAHSAHAPYSLSHDLHAPDDAGGPLNNALHFAGVFVLGLLFLGLAPVRLREATSELAARPLRSGGLGLAAGMGAAVAILVLFITLVGIPAALAGVATLAIVGHLGVAVSAAVLGALLPIEKLSEKPVLQLAAGTGALFVLSLVPVLGDLATLAAVCVGLGALMTVWQSRKREKADRGEAPLRTAAYR